MPRNKHSQGTKGLTVKTLKKKRKKHNKLEESLLFMHWRINEKMARIKSNLHSLKQSPSKFQWSFFA